MMTPGSSLLSLTLVVQLDPVATAERMQRAIAGSELVVIGGHTHLVQVERPDEVHAAIDAFLARHRL